MPTSLTAEQIVALAPDPASAKSGRDLANPRKWQNLGQNEIAAWGECQGSGKDPYKVQVDLREPAFRCSCPSRKFPCKHGIGLLLLLSAQPAAFATADPPAAVTEWLQKREQTAQKRAEPGGAADAPPVAPKRAAASRSAAAREAKVTAGLEELDRWMTDLIRQGFAAIQGRGHRFWDDVAARMVDAQAPGVARMVRDLASVVASGEGWQSRLLERLARLHLLIEGYRRRADLSPDMLAEVRTQIGWAQDQDALRAGPLARDRWMALGQYVSDEDQLRVQRTWLWGETSGRAALLLSFAPPGQPLDRSIVVGAALDADLAFFAGVAPLRALVAQRYGAPLPITAMPGHPTLSVAIAAYADTIALNPWLERYPLPLAAVTPRREGDRWLVCDSEGRMAPLTVNPTQGWRLIALGGGGPVTLFGEWDGASLTPLSVWDEGTIIRLEA